LLDTTKREIKQYEEISALRRTTIL